MTDADGYFGESVAATYDDDTDNEEFSPEVVGATADVLADLARGGPALEFAIGTGRIAVPLAERGVPVTGIELSRAMAARLAARNNTIPVTIGDMSTTRVEGTFTVVYLVFNTILNLTTQAAQVACFANAAAHLAPGGCFVVEAGIPELRKLPHGQTIVPFLDRPGLLGYDRYDTATQAMSSNYVSPDGYRSIPFRYVWPSELDLMAQLAGLRLRDRWESWDHSPFTHESPKHVSIWEKPA